MDKFLIPRDKAKEETFVIQNKPSDHQEEQEPGSEVGFQIITKDGNPSCQKQDDFSKNETKSAHRRHDSRKKALFKTGVEENLDLHGLQSMHGSSLIIIRKEHFIAHARRQ